MRAYLEANYRSLWVLFHLTGFATWFVPAVSPVIGVDPEGAFRAYLYAFLVLEAVSILVGYPMTRAVRSYLSETTRYAMDGTIAVLVVYVWVSIFLIGCIMYGPFSPGVNAFTAILVLGVWFNPHFYGERW